MLRVGVVDLFGYSIYMAKGLCSVRLGFGKVSCFRHGPERHDESEFTKIRSIEAFRRRRSGTFSLLQRAARRFKPRNTGFATRGVPFTYSTCIVTCESFPSQLSESPYSPRGHAQKQFKKHCLMWDRRNTMVPYHYTTYVSMYILFQKDC